MKLSEFITELQQSVERYGDRDLLDMPPQWLEDFLPDELARWFLVNGHCQVSLLPDGFIAPAFLDQDLEDSELPTVSAKLQDAVVALAQDPEDREAILMSLRQAIEVVQALNLSGP